MDSRNRVPVGELAVRGRVAQLARAEAHTQTNGSDVDRAITQRRGNAEPAEHAEPFCVSVGDALPGRPSENRFLRSLRSLRSLFRDHRRSTKPVSTLMRVPYFDGTAAMVIGTLMMPA